jgi:hypothetical protein
MTLFKLCKQQKSPRPLVFVGLEKERQIGRSQPKSNLFKSLMNPSENY